MFDFIGWISRAQEFVETLTPDYNQFGFGFIKHTAVEPPLTPEEMAHLQSLLPFSLPQALVDFYGQGSRCCECSYRWLVSPDEFERAEMVLGRGGAYGGGAAFFDAFELVEHVRLYREDWPSQVFADYPQEAQLRRNALPFMEAHFHLALDLSENIDNPPVVWMHPESFSQRLAPSFTDFLTAWEKLCYIGPRMEELGRFLNRDAGVIETYSPRAESLRTLFQPHSQRSTS